MMDRNVDFERTATEQYAHGMDVDELIRFSQARADAHGPTRPARPQGLRREVLEELADARNYLVWWLQAIHHDEIEGDPDAIGRSLAAVAVAWEALT